MNPQSSTPHIAILALDGVLAGTVSGPQDVFSLSGVLWQRLHGDEPAPDFTVRVISPDGRPVRACNSLILTPHAAANEIRPDVIVLPAIMDIDATLARDRPVLEWLRAAYDRGCILAAICSGALLLAETGLLDSREATTHWALVGEFRKRYPAVLLRPDELITDSDNLVCSGAYSSYLDLVIHLIGRLRGHRAALRCSKLFLHDPGRRSQAPYSVFAGRHDHDDRQILAIQEELEDNPAHSFDFDRLARRHGMGRRTMERHFKDATGLTPLTYLQRLRVEKAKQLLETGTASFDEISYQVGYQDNSFFRKLFVKYTSLLPGEYRARFSRRGRYGIRTGPRNDRDRAGVQDMDAVQDQAAGSALRCP